MKLLIIDNNSNVIEDKNENENENVLINSDNILLKFNFLHSIFLNNHSETRGIIFHTHGQCCK